MKRSHLLQELKPFFLRWLEQGADAGLTVGEGPGIDLVGATVGLGGDLPLVLHADGSPVSEYDTIAAALAGVSNGETILLPSRTFSEDVEMVAGITIRGLGIGSVIAGTVTGANGAVLQGVYVRVVGDDADPLYGIKGAGALFRVLDCTVYVENATGPARAMGCTGGKTYCQNVTVLGASGGSEGYGFYAAAGELYLDDCIARATDCTTAPMNE